MLTFGQAAETDPSYSARSTYYTCGVGMITNAFQAETALQLQACDVIDVGRGILSDLNWGWHAARDLHAEVQPPLERIYTLRF